MHCNPAPPHPPPDMVYHAICPPLAGWPESLALFAVLLVTIAGLGWVLGYHAQTDDERQNRVND